MIKEKKKRKRRKNEKEEWIIRGKEKQKCVKTAHFPGCSYRYIVRNFNYAL